MESLIFKPSQQKLMDTRRKRKSDWNVSKKNVYSQEQIIERLEAENQVLNAMSILKERVNQCLMET